MLSKKLKYFWKMLVIVLAISFLFTCTSATKTIEELQDANKADPYAFPLDPSPNGSGGAQTMIPGKTPYDSLRPRYSYFTDIGLMRTYTRDAEPLTVIVDVVLGYDQNDNAAMTELKERLYELRDFVGSFFRSKTAMELHPENEARLKEEIIDLLNLRILSNTRIRMVYFNQLDIMDM
jgi:flagellar FliL protein